MKPLTRNPQNKARAASKFRKHVGHTKAANLQLNPMRGGWRL